MTTLENLLDCDDLQNLIFGAIQNVAYSKTWLVLRNICRKIYQKTETYHKKNVFVIIMPFRKLIDNECSDDYVVLMAKYNQFNKHMFERAARSDRLDILTSINPARLFHQDTLAHLSLAYLNHWTLIWEFRKRSSFFDKCLKLATDNSNWNVLYWLVTKYHYKSSPDVTDYDAMLFDIFDPVYLFGLVLWRFHLRMQSQMTGRLLANTKS